MVSTLKLTKIQIPNSDSDVISLDASTGNVTVPKNITVSGTLGGTSIAVQGEGTATTNLQQGLVKSWVFSGEDASLTNAFNTASGTDNSTGNYSFTYTSNLSNSDPSAAASVTDNSDRNATVYSSTTTGYTTEVFNQAGNEADTRNRTIICGDLA